MGNETSIPTVDKVDSEEYLTSSGLLIGASGLQGHREEMEDTHLIFDIPSRPSHTVVAIFDGHGGFWIAKYLKENFVRVYEETEEWKEYLTIKESEIIDQVSDLENALMKTFLCLDEEMKATNKDSFLCSGSTACVSLITPHHIVCANAGDSRCVVGTVGTARALALSHDHKPERPSERSRIEAAGGCVNFGRVDGELSVSRGFGDGKFKSNLNIDLVAQKVSPQPDITVHMRDDNCDDVLIVACDGLWDVIDSTQAVEKIRDLYDVGERSGLLLAEELIHGALFEGKSKDNISAAVCILPAATFGPEESGGVTDIRSARKFFRQDEFGLPKDMYDNVVGKKAPSPQPGSVFYNSDCDY